MSYWKKTNASFRRSILSKTYSLRLVSCTIPFLWPSLLKYNYFTYHNTVQNYNLFYIRPPQICLLFQKSLSVILHYLDWQCKITKVVKFTSPCQLCQNSSLPKFTELLDFESASLIRVYICTLYEYNGDFQTSPLVFFYDDLWWINEIISQQYLKNKPFIFIPFDILIK